MATETPERPTERCQEKTSAPNPSNQTASPSHLRRTSTLNHNGHWYVVAYTDGSAFNTHCRYMARAGWSVWYADKSPYNTYDGLAIALQTTYRGEPVAILHIFQTAGAPTQIKCDCKSVVDLANNILNDEELDVAELTDGDLWQKLQIPATYNRTIERTSFASRGSPATAMKTAPNANARWKVGQSTTSRYMATAKPTP